MTQNSTPKSALVVDDNYYNRDLSALALRHVGYQVVEAIDGAQAIALLEKRQFDLLVLDLAMPEVDGVSVLRHLTERQLSRSMCVLVVTANPHMATAEVEAIADHVMYKPIDVAEFARFAQRMQNQIKH